MRLKELWPPTHAVCGAGNVEHALWSRAGRSSRQARLKPSTRLPARIRRSSIALEAIDGFGDDAVDGVDEAGRK